MPTRHPPVEGSWSAGKSPAARRLAVPLREFLDTEVAGGLVLRLRAGTLPIGVTNRQVVAVAAVAGIGFTMSLFIVGLAYPASELPDQGRVGILAGSLLAAALGTLVLRGSLPRRAIPGGIPGKEDR